MRWSTLGIDEKDKLIEQLKDRVSELEGENQDLRDKHMQTSILLDTERRNAGEREREAQLLAAAANASSMASQAPATANGTAGVGVGAGVGGTSFTGQQQHLSTSGNESFVTARDVSMVNSLLSMSEQELERLQQSRVTTLRAVIENASRVLGTIDGADMGAHARDRDERLARTVL